MNFITKNTQTFIKITDGAAPYSKSQNINRIKKNFNIKYKSSDIIKIVNQCVAYVKTLYTIIDGKCIFNDYNDIDSIEDEFEKEWQEEAETERLIYNIGKKNKIKYHKNHKSIKKIANPILLKPHSISVKKICDTIYQYYGEQKRTWNLGHIILTKYPGISEKSITYSILLKVIEDEMIAIARNPNIELHYLKKFGELSEVYALEIKELLLKKEHESKNEIETEKLGNNDNNINDKNINNDNELTPELSNLKINTPEPKKNDDNDTDNVSSDEIDDDDDNW